MTPSRARRPAVLVAAALLWAAPAAAQRIAELQIAPPYLRMVPNAMTQLTATAYDQDGNPVDIPVRWTSTNINVISVQRDGMARAVAPGRALITAVVEQQGRRVTARMNVVVSHTSSDRVVVVPIPGTPPPGTGPMPPPAGAPGTPAAPVVPMPPRAMSTGDRYTDSVLKASINCAEPFVNAANPMRFCWDTRATTRGHTHLPRPTACNPETRPVAIHALIQEDGRVESARVFIPSLCAAMDEAALALVRELPFDPARKEGRPVRSWVMLRVEPR